MSPLQLPLAVILVTLPALVFSFCSYGKPEIETTDLGDLKYCLYKDVKIVPGGKFRDLDECVQVRCTQKYYVKCGFGKKAGVMIPPPGCKNAFMGCTVKIIQDPNSTATCPVVSR